MNYRYAGNESGIQMHCPELCLAFKFEINQNPLKFTNFSKRVTLSFCSCDSKLILNAGGGRRSNSRIGNSHSLSLSAIPKMGKPVNSRTILYYFGSLIPLGIFLIRDNLISVLLRGHVLKYLCRLQIKNGQP